LQQCEEELAQNSISQRDACQKINSVVKKISEYEQIYLISMDNLFKNTLASNIITKLESKKAKKLEEGIVEKYDKPKRPFAAMIYSNFGNKIHSCIEYGAAYQKRRKVFIKTLAEVFVDNKAKVSLGVSAVGHTFKTIQTINEPVLVADHDFLVGSKIKLIPSVYLIIDPANSNDSFRLGQLAIFIRPKYFYNEKNKVKPVWVLLVDGGPDENPKHMKNIIHAYNPIERSIASLFEKLADITLLIDEFRSHLDSQ
ncbi:29457_t:CDS:2, partial [Gigaspora margarita]